MGLLYRGLSRQEPGAKPPQVSLPDVFNMVAISPFQHVNPADRLRFHAHWRLQ